jgi:dienelactone hydrolase
MAQKSKKWRLLPPGRSGEGRFYPPLALLTLLGFQFFSVFQSCVYSEELPPASAFQVYHDPVAAGPRITPYLRYQLDRAWQQDEKRLQQWAAIRTEADLRALQDQTRRKLLELLGGLPSDKSPLNPKIMGKVAGDGFRVEKVIFESLPHFYVTALLYLPEKSAGPFPGVLVACGHGPSGKIYYQSLCQRLAKRGYAVICWDPVGQGERSQFWDAAAGKSRYNMVCGEHAVLSNQAYLAGANLARWEIWDGMRALDYLLTRPEVDPKRISITGTSGGGFQAVHIAALDGRIRVAAPSCYINSLPMRMANRIFKDPDSDPEQDLYRMVEAGIDHAGLLLLIYPRPLILSAAVEDFFPIEGTRRSFREIAAIYRRFGHGDEVEMVEGYHPHRFSEENQAAALAFMDRFNHQTATPGLPAVTPFDESSLRCTRSGQLLLEFAEAQPLTEIIRRYSEGRRGKVRNSLASLYRRNQYPGIEKWPAVPDDGSSSAHRILWKKTESTTSGRWQFDHYLLRHSGRLTIPLVQISEPGRKVKSDLVKVWLKESGKIGPQEWPLLVQSLELGDEIVTFDFRGQGEDAMQYSTTGIDAALGGSATMMSYDDPLSSVLANYVYNSLLIGRPYFLEMLEDTEIVLQFLRAHSKPGRICVETAVSAHLLGWAIHAVFPGTEKCKTPVGPPFNKWSDWAAAGGVEWPIQFLLPGGAFVE